MKTVFKASLLASALAFSLGSQAATVSSTPKALSAEGVSQGLIAAGEDLQFDIAVDALHPSASTITLTFDANVDLTGVAAAAGGTVTQNAGSGTGASGDIVFSYGTGSFTFDNVVIDTTTATKAQTIKFQVNLGNPLTASSAFRININGSDTDIKGASSLMYSSKTSGGQAIETGSGVIATTKSQFAFSVTNDFDARIERVARVSFTDTGVTDTLSISLSNDESLAAALTAVAGTTLLEGDFTGLVASEFVAASLTSTTPTAAVADEDEFTFTIVAGDITDAGVANLIDHVFTRAGGAVITPSGPITATVTITSTNGTGPIVLATDADAGEWLLDASIVNVPYLPVGYGLSPNVEISNDGTSDAQIQLEAFDQNGMTYGPVTLTKVATRKTVTKVSEADMISAFGLSASDKKKLSVTFILDADAEKITLAPYYKEGTSRVNVMSDQYKGK